MCHWGLVWGKSQQRCFCGLSGIPASKTILSLFTPASSATISHCFVYCYKRRLFVSGGNNCKCVLNESEFLFSDQMSHHIVSNKVCCRDYWRLSYVCCIGVYLISLHSIAYHIVIKQNALLVSSLPVLILTHLEYFCLTFC